MAFGEFTPGTININVRGPDGKLLTFDVSDYGPYPIYSAVDVATTASTPITFFQFGFGSTRPSNGGAATKWDTNLQSNAGTLGAVDEMLIWSMRIAFEPAINRADILDSLEKVYYALHIATEKPTAEGDGSYFPAGGGAYGVTTQSATEVWVNGVPAASASRVFAQPHYLPGIVQFYGRLEPKAALALSAVREHKWTLDGLRRRPSQ